MPRGRPKAPEGPEIDGFDRRGYLYRAVVTLERRDAERISQEAIFRGAPVTQVIRDMVRAMLAGNGRPSSG